MPVSKVFDYQGQRLTINEIAEMTHINVSTLRYQVSALGKTPQQAVSDILSKKYKKKICVSDTVSDFDPGTPSDVPQGHPDLKAMRMRLGLETKEVAHRCDMRDDTYRMIEAGFITHPELACRIGRFFNLSDDEIRTMVHACRYGQIENRHWIRPFMDEEEEKERANRWSAGMSDV